MSAPPDVDSSSTSGDLDSNVKHPNSEGDSNRNTGPQHTSLQPSNHRSAPLPPSRGSSPPPNSSHRNPVNSYEHDSSVEDPDFPTQAALLQAQHPPLRHKASSSSEKSKKRFLGVRRTSRSPSLGLGSRPSSREPSPASSQENLRTPTPEPPNSSSLHSDARPTKSPVPSGQPSLLSTLKSRAGDRQALSNTAKETMRKWTVNWGGLRKDRDSSATSSEDAQDGQDTKTRPASQKVKSSYAEIRAAVDGRREKERQVPDDSSAPIRIPGRGHKERSVSVSSTYKPQGSSLSSSQTGSAPAPSSADHRADGFSPELSSTRPPAIDVDGMPLDSQDLDGMSPAPVTAISSSPPPPLPQRPIQSQPSQGKTMTIPGIHARNRGEVMSMGYVPPSPPAPEAKSGVSGVYRLWKHSPATPSEHGDGDAERASPHSPAVLSVGGAETSPEPSHTNAAQPQAPPLPPRTPSSLHSVPSDSSSTSPASAALKSIVSRDEECRVQDGEGLEASSPAGPESLKPPLPPRKIQASA